MANGPSTITVIRHGEKPADGEPKPPHGIDSAGEKHPSSLITRGWQRAGALAVILGGQRPPAPLVRPTVLVSPDYGPETRFHRTSQTILPLAERLGLTPVHPARTGHEAHVVKHAILPATGHVLVCWEHHHIPDIMAALADKLGITQLPSIARKWPDDDFDSVLVVTVEAQLLSGFLQTHRAAGRSGERGDHLARALGVGAGSGSNPPSTGTARPRSCRMAPSPSLISKVWPGWMLSGPTALT